MTSSVRFAVPFKLVLHTSFLLNGLLFMMYLGAFSWLWVMDLPLWLALPLKLALVLGFVFHLRVHLFRNSARTVMEMVWFGGDDWQLRDAGDQQHQVKLQGNSLVSPWLIILNFKSVSGRCKWPVIMMPDSLDSTSFRRLSAKLRMHGAGLSSEAA